MSRGGRRTRYVEPDPDYDYDPEGEAHAREEAELLEADYDPDYDPEGAEAYASQDPDYDPDYDPEGEEAYAAERYGTRVCEDTGRCYIQQGGEDTGKWFSTPRRAAKWLRRKGLA